MSQKRASALTIDASATTGRLPAYLAELRRYTGGNSALDREILELFASGTPVHFNCLQNDRDGDLPCTAAEWHLAIHTIKSSCVTIGAWDAADIAVCLLDMPFDVRTDAHYVLVHKLGIALEAVYRHLEDLLQDI